MKSRTYLPLDEAAGILSSLLGGHVDAWRILLERDHSTHPRGRRFAFIEQAGAPLVCTSAIAECLWSELEDGRTPGTGLAVGSVESSSFEVAARAVLDRNSGGRAVLELRIPERYQGTPRISPADARLLADHLLYLAELCEHREEERATAPAYPASANSMKYGTGDPELDDLLAALGGDDSSTQQQLTEAVQ